MWDRSKSKAILTSEMYHNFCNSIRILKLEVIVDVMCFHNYLLDEANLELI